MRREPSLTLEGALRILGHHEPRLIGKLDKILGGVILAAGAGAGIAALGGAPLAPLALFAAVWGWTEQKNAAIELAKDAIGAVSGKLAGTVGYERRQLIAAAHTTIVVAAFFESFREHAGKEFYDQLKIADAEKETLIAGRSMKTTESLLDMLYAAEVPAPSPSRGFEENIAELVQWADSIVADMYISMGIITSVAGFRVETEAILSGFSERYRSHFLVLAAKVPEFMIWALLGENAATRSAVGELRADMATALDGARGALARVESMLALETGAITSNGVTDLRTAVGRANRGILRQPIIPTDPDRYGPDIEFPAIGRIYINPRYRIADTGNRMLRLDEYRPRPADEDWWGHQPSHDDFDLMLAGYVSSPDATRLPLLLLGHPGAGKSMLTKVFAARLPTSAYTVVRVPLRRVGANAPLIDQIQQGLDLATNRRVDWSRLSEQSAGTIRVVLLDGLDELLQASNSDRSGYLQEVMEFQRREADQQAPVIVVVTSRTVVADRVDIPQGTTVVKLDTFEESDIAEWLNGWHEANDAAIAAGKMRGLTLSAALKQPDLARQPLLLLMLALYAADPKLPPLDDDLSTAGLYERLLDGFARREASKSAGHNVHSHDTDQRVRDHLDRLAVAALAMFNRGRQDISEEEVGADLAVLDETLMGRSRPVEAGQRIIGEFFFVHAAEAQLLSAPSEPVSSAVARAPRREALHRNYEFLHATFGEYLVASRVMGELVDVAEKAFAGRRGPTDPDDDLLFALLSHQPLAGRGSIITFAREISDRLSGQDQGHVREVLEALIGSFRHRHGSNRYASYRPVPPDSVRELACYSANLVALRVSLEPDDGVVPLDKLLHVPADRALQQWRSTVSLWKSGLDDDGLQAMLATLYLADGPLGITMDVRWDMREYAVFGGNSEASWTELSLARLIYDRETENRLRFGHAIQDGFSYTTHQDDWRALMASCLIPSIVGLPIHPFLSDAPPGTSGEDAAFVARLIFKYFRSGQSTYGLSQGELLKILFNLPADEFQLDGAALALAVISDPALVEAHPELKRAKTYGAAYELIRAVGTPDLLNAIKGVKSAGKVLPHTEDARLPLLSLLGELELIDIDLNRLGDR